MEADKTSLEAQLQASLNGLRKPGRPSEPDAQGPKASKPGRRKARVAKADAAPDANPKQSVQTAATPEPSEDGISPVRNFTSVVVLRR